MLHRRCNVLVIVEERGGNPTSPLATTSAAGAPFDQIIIVAAFTALVYGGVAWVALRDRTGHHTLLGSLARYAADLTGTPRWFALPQLITLAGLASAVVGVYWDVSYHLSNGRDAGPLANPSHYLIFLGLVAIFAGAMLGIAFATEDLPRRTLRITRNWRTPYGPVISLAVGMIALTGFPLDDLWHRLFGQDVTEWGPTHVLMIGGSVLACLGILVSAAESRQVAHPHLRPHQRLVPPAFEGLAVLIFLAGPAAFLLEFAFGIPQFPLIDDALMIALMSSLAFVTASFAGARAVVALWVAYVAVQFALAGLNVYVFDALMPWPTLLAGGALVALVLSPFARPTLRYGVLAGALVAAGAVVGDYFWTNAVRPMPWPAALLPIALAYAVPLGAAVGVIAVWLRVRITEIANPDAQAQRSPERPIAFGLAAAAAMAAALGLFGWNVPPRHDAHVVANVIVVDATTGPQASARLRVELEPKDAADNAFWFQSLSWQGGGAVHADLHQVAPGVYETSQRVPAYGNWKTLIRLHLPTHTLIAAPIYLPADEAIPVSEYALADGPRDFVAESKILRREEKPGVAPWISSLSYAVVGGLFLMLFVLIGAGVTLASRREDLHLPTKLAHLIGASR